MNKLSVDIDDTIQHLTNYNFEQFDNTIEGQAYFMIDKLFNINIRILKLTYI